MKENLNLFVRAKTQTDMERRKLKFVYKIAIISSFIITTTTFILFVYSALKVQILSQELDQLKKEIQNIKTTLSFVDIDEFYPNFPVTNIDEEEISQSSAYDSENNFGFDYEENDKLLFEENVNHAIFNKSEMIIPIVKREANQADYYSEKTEQVVTGELTNRNDILEPINENEDFFEQNGKRQPKAVSRNVRAKNSWKVNSEIEEIEPKIVAPTRKRNRNKHRNNLENLEQAIVHFSGDTSRYELGKHENFRGNGHLRHPDQTFADWKESDWVRPLGMYEKFDLVNGFLKIKENGLYFIYAQIYYLDEHDTNGFHVYKNRNPVLQCTVMTHSMSTVTKGNTCYTAGVEYLRDGDEISIKDVASHRYSLFEPGKSFFGVIKLGDAKVK